MSDGELAQRQACPCQRVARSARLVFARDTLAGLAYLRLDDILFAVSAYFVDRFATLMGDSLYYPGVDAATLSVGDEVDAHLGEGEG